MKIIKSFLSIATILTLTSCDGGIETFFGNKTTSDDGVSQGNGMVAYSSAVYKYRVLYASNLKVNETSDKEVTFDNSPLVKAGEQISSLTLKALGSHDLNGQIINSPEALYRYLTQTYPNQSWVQVKYRGAVGYFSDATLTTSVDSEYYIYSEGQNIIYGKMTISNHSSGSEHIKAIISTFSIDDKPPVVTGLKLESTTLKAGQKSRLWYEATDDVSGLHHISGRFFLKNSKSGGGDVVLGQKIIPQGNNWYSIEFTLNDYLAPGEYTLQDFSAMDVARNEISLIAWPSETVYHTEDNQRKFGTTNIPVIKMMVTNDKTYDNNPPVVTEIKFLTPQIEAGKNGSILFKVTDDVSGFFRLYAQFVKIGSKSSYADIHVVDAKPVGNDWYQIDFLTNRYLATGTYDLRDISVTDKAGNEATLWHYEGVNNEMYLYKNDQTGKLSETQVPNVKLNLVNDALADSIAPLISEIKLENLTSEADGMGKLLFKATDTGSGLGKDFLSAQGRFFLKGSKSGSGDINIAVARSLGNDWYAIEFHVGPFLPAGEYTLRDLTLQDLAGNRINIQGSETDSVYRSYDDQKNYYTTQMPIIKLTVE